MDFGQRSSDCMERSASPCLRLSGHACVGLASRGMVMTTASLDTFRVVVGRRERFVELLGKPNRRRDILRTLYHFADLDPRFIRRTLSPMAMGTRRKATASA